MTFDLPMPPTTNNLFASDKRRQGVRYPTPAYKAWKKAAGEQLGQQYAAYGSPAIHRPLALTIKLGINYQSDIANREKALTDLLVATLDMPDDRYIERLVIERDPAVTGARVTIEDPAGADAWQPIGEVAARVVARIAAKMDAAA